MVSTVFMSAQYLLCHMPVCLFSRAQSSPKASQRSPAPQQKHADCAKKGGRVRTENRPQNVGVAH